MNRILVIIYLPEESVGKIKLNPDLQQEEGQYVTQWQQSGILENIFITASRDGAVLVFKDTDKDKVKELIESLPYFPFMAKIEYFDLDRHF